MNPLWILAAFLFGAIISRIGLPPLVGYLLAGFALNSVGVTGGELLESVADAGVTLLLFTIGLKLKIKIYEFLVDFGSECHDHQARSDHRIAGKNQANMFDVQPPIHQTAHGYRAQCRTENSHRGRKASDRSQVFDTVDLGPHRRDGCVGNTDIDTH